MEGGKVTEDLQLRRESAIWRISTSLTNIVVETQKEKEPAGQ